VGNNGGVRVKITLLNGRISRKVRQQLILSTSGTLRRRKFLNKIHQVWNQCQWSEMLSVLPARSFPHPACFHSKQIYCNQSREGLATRRQRHLMRFTQRQLPASEQGGAGSMTHRCVKLGFSFASTMRWRCSILMYLRCNYTIRFAMTLARRCNTSIVCQWRSIYEWFVSWYLHSLLPCFSGCTCLKNQCIFLYDVDISTERVCLSAAVTVADFATCVAFKVQFHYLLLPVN